MSIMVLTSNKHFILQFKTKQLNKDILMTVFNWDYNVYGAGRISVLTPPCASTGILTNLMVKCSLTMTDYVNKERINPILSSAIHNVWIWMYGFKPRLNWQVKLWHIWWMIEWLYVICTNTWCWHWLLTNLSVYFHIIVNKIIMNH